MLVICVFYWVYGWFMLVNVGYMVCYMARYMVGYMGVYYTYIYIYVLYGYTINHCTDCHVVGYMGILGILSTVIR